MKHLAPEGPVYQAGTLSGNPLAVAAGRATLALLKDGAIYRRLEGLGRRLREGIEENIRGLGVPVTYAGIGSLGCLYFRAAPIRSWDDAKQADTARFRRYFREMLQLGVYLAPSQFEAAFLCAAHTEEDVDWIVGSNRRALAIAFEETP
jgi:glutamate-1-semialdehyde 2,1-aminomutase